MFAGPEPRSRRTCTARFVVALRLVGVLLSCAVPAPCFARAPWVTLQGGRYLVKRANDGDSFHISIAGKEYIFRLYFVDAPETSADFPDRVEEQARHFAISAKESLVAGHLAQQFTREKLSEPFLVRTCWEDAMGRSRMQRFYAFVQTRDGDLGEQLVENGLARTQTATGKPEGLKSAASEWQKLAKLERNARQEKVGAWGANENRISVRAQQPESEKGVDPFDRFFRPEMTATQNAAEAAPAGSVAPPATPSSTNALAQSSSSQYDLAQAATKLDANIASQAELENISGIGPIIATRIIAARPFKSADELRKVKGIGDVRYERIRPFFQ